MNNAPYDSKISDKSEGMFTLPWKMWISNLFNYVNALPYDAQTVISGRSFTVIPPSYTPSVSDSQNILANQIFGG